ncbi:MAG: outer membrane protein assembly factor BamD [bacterium]
MKMKARTAVSAVLILSLLCLGAFDPFQSPSKKELLTRLEKLEKQNMELEQQVSDLERRMNILTQRVNAVYSGQKSGQYVGGGKAHAGSSPSAVPDLDVVRVSPEKKKQSSAGGDSGRRSGGKGGKILIQKREGNTVSLVEHKSGKKQESSPLPGTNYIPPPDPETDSDKQKTKERDSGSSSPPTMASRKSEPEKGSSSQNSSKQKESASEKDLYQELQSLWKSDDEGGAVPKMKSYLNRYPKGSHVDEVSFRLGRALYRRGDYNDAIRYLSLVTEDYPTSSYAAHSLYLTGLSYLELGRTDKAADVLREVKILYPFSKSAKKAEEKLSSCCP